MGSLIDTETLMFMNFLLSAVSALVMFALYSGNRKARGLWCWACSNICFAVGFFLLLHRWMHLPYYASVLIPNLLIDLGAILVLIAVVQFLEQPRRALWPILPGLCLMAIEIGHFFWSGLDMGKMVPLGASARALVTIGAGWQLWRHSKPYSRPASGLSAMFHFAWAAMLISRVAWWIFSQFKLVDQDPTTTYALLMRIVLTFAVTPSYLWMLTRELDQELFQLAKQDPLTGVANRRVMWDAGRRAVAAAERGNWTTGILMMDVDHFKSVNDRFGHCVGDDVLSGIAATLAANVRETDTVARVGGEEFMVLLPRTNPEEALYAADRLRTAVENLEFPLEGGGILRCTISVGMSFFRQDAQNWESLVSSADRALYCAKHLGRNRVETPPPVEPVDNGWTELSVRP
ncbi:GGDEF domain-containing protein [Sphingobium sp. H39-3-25]|uniref:GGDEF domain-containing protein n=1 Tax=Sphingobium arseniciresistens TaxID=3030834 RepID=UPI0023B95F7F|nr:GGDEF domain-containing protein [Sphingobium arseniciresistens]